MLHCKLVAKYLVVANTHLYSKPNADDIRLLQAIILNQLRPVVDTIIIEHNLDIPQVSAVFCGDFNTIPRDPIHRMVTRRNVKCKRSKFVFDQVKLKTIPSSPPNVVPNSIVGYIQSAFDFLMRRGMHALQSELELLC